MNVALKDTLNKLLMKFGMKMKSNLVDIDMEQNPYFMELYDKVRPFTMTPKESIYSIYQAINYLHKAKVEGDVVECGVWRGGCSMASALIWKDLGETNRNVYLYDTFEGMNPPTSVDVSVRGYAGAETWKGKDRCYADEQDVRTNMGSTGYPAEKVNYIVGKVEDTLPKVTPEKIAFLRLDTDWFESTYTELVHLYPKLVPGGVLIIDDYGYWEGARKAVDQYFEEQKIPVLMNRVNYSIRLIVKQ